MLQPSLNPNSKSSRAGFSLVEILISIGIMFFAIAAIGNLLSNTEAGIKVSELMEVRDEIARNIARNLQQYERIVYAAANSGHSGNKELYSCIAKPNINGNHNLTPTCVKTDRKNPVPFVLVVKSGKTTSTPLAGDVSGGDAIYYDRKGRRCPDGDNRCHFWQAKTWFYATCISPQGAPNIRQASDKCFQARSVSFQYQVSLKDRAVLSRIKNAPANLRDKPLRREDSTITHQVGGLLVNQQCPPNSIPTGYTTDGRIMCQCISGSIKLPGLNPDGSIRCSTPVALQCGPREFFRGVDPLGKPICIRRNLRCGVPAETGGQSEASCKQGGWLTNFNFGECYASATNKKGENRKITCRNYGGSCCQYERE